MKRWRAILHVRSPLATPLSAERLFGHICWGLSYREGPEAVADLLARMRSEDPPLVLGEPASLGFMPMPITLRSGQVSLELRGKRQGLWDLYRRSGWMPQAALLQAAADLGDPTTVTAALDASGWPTPVLPARQVQARSAASRITGAPAGRTDWLAVESWSQDDAGQVAVPMVSDLEAGEIERLLRAGLENGFGRAASVGYGQVDLASLEAVSDWPAVTDANAVVTLGPCVPRQDDPAGGFWQVQTRWGKLGGGYATQVVAVEKRPVLVLQPGAVLQGATSRDHAGRLVEDVHPARPEVVHYGMAPVLAVRLRVEA